MAATLRVALTLALLVIGRCHYFISEGANVRHRIRATAEAIDCTMVIALDGAALIGHCGDSRKYKQALSSLLRASQITNVHVDALRRHWSFQSGPHKLVPHP